MSSTEIVHQAEAKYSPEAQEAETSKHYARELRRLLKRREALSSVRPFIAAIVAVADAWRYENGVLLYMNHRQLRIIDLHHSASTELVVDVHKLVGEAIPKSSSRQDFRFEPLYMAKNVVSCLYKPSARRRDGWLIVFSAKEKRILTAHRLETTSKIFVRNNGAFLYYGTHRYLAHYEGRRWELRAYNLQDGKWLADSLVLGEPLGVDIGSTTCFDICDEYFYGLSNSERPLESEQHSYYTGFRFPTNESGFGNIRWSQARMWRRRHNEGTIDDRWTFLRNVRNERTGQRMIIESRREWLCPSTFERRLYYMEFDEFRDSKYEAPETYSAHDEGEGSNESRGRMCDTGDDNDALAALPRIQRYILSYHLSCHTLLDLVNDTSPGANKCHVRLRGTSRSTRFSSALQPVAEHEFLFWPPDQDPKHTDAELENLKTLLNSPVGPGIPCRGEWDDRSYVYSGETAEACRAIVFLSFDPAIHLEGVVPYPGNPPIGRPRGEWMPFCAPNPDLFVPSPHPVQEMSQEETSLASEALASCENAEWCRTESAMYRSIARGYHFFPPGRLNPSSEGSVRAA